MDDSRRNLEQSALRNVRSLFERLDRIDRAARKREVITAAAIVVVAAALLGLFALAMQRPYHDPDQQRQRACELDALNARSAEFERQMASSNPGMPYRDIQKRLERERAFLTAAAKVDCNQKAR
jgi:hypothetical protein